MALVIENRRRVEKRSTISGERPTIPASNDHTDGSWIDTDIYEGEFFYNLPDGLIFSREGNTIVEIGMPEGIIQNPYFPFTNPIVNGSDAVNFNVNNFTFRFNSRFISHPTTADEVTISDGHATLPRIDLLWIDDNNAVVVTEGTPIADPTTNLPEIPISSNGRVLGFKLAYIYVPALHVAGSTPLTPISIDRVENKDKVITDWLTGTTYLTGMLFLENRVMYRVKKAHISTTVSADIISGLVEEISFADGNGIYQGSGSLSGDTVIDGLGNKIEFNNNNQVTLVATNLVRLVSSDKIQIQSINQTEIIGGNVAIGHSFPLAQLHIYGSGSTSSTKSLLIHNSISTKTLEVLDDATVGLSIGAYINEFSIDGTMAGNSDLSVPTEKAVVTYVASKISNGIYSGSGTIPTTTVATITDNINFTGGNFGIGVTPTARLDVAAAIGTNGVKITGGGTTSGTTSLLVQNSVGTDIFKINDDQSVAIGTYTTKPNLTNVLINGNSGNSQSNAIGLHVKGNIDNGTTSDICLIEHTNTSGGALSTTSNVLRVATGMNITGAITGLAVNQTGATSVGTTPNSLSQLKVNHTYENNTSAPHSTIGVEVINAVTRTANFGGIHAYKHGAKIDVSGTWNNTLGTPYEAIAVGLEVNVSGGDFNYAGLFNGGNVGIGTSTPDSSALLDMVSTSQGFAPPSMTGTQVEAISSPKISLIVYATNAGVGDVTTAGWWGWNGTNWIQLG